MHPLLEFSPLAAARGVHQVAFQLQIPVEVKLMTTRGGTWPERREQIVFATDI